MDKYVACPACHGRVLNDPRELNTHLDRCLHSGELQTPTHHAGPVDEDIRDNDEDPANQKLSTALTQFLSILPDGTSREAASRILDRADGIVGDAVEMFFEASHGLGESSMASSPAKAHKQTESPSPSSASKKRKQTTLASFLTNRGSKDTAASYASTKAVSSKRIRTELPPPASTQDQHSKPISSPASAFAVDEGLTDNQSSEATMYTHMATTFAGITAIKGRIEITNRLSNMFIAILQATKHNLELQKKTLLAAVYLCTNSVAPQHHGVELGVGGSTISAALTEVTGKSREYLRQSYKKCGDLGDVAFHAKSTVRAISKPKSLSIVEVFDSILSLASMTGQGSTLRKRSLIVKLLVRARGEEVRFLVRTLLQHLRTGAVGKILQAGVAQAFCNYNDITKKEHVDANIEILKIAFSVHPQWDTTINALVHGGFDRVKQVCVATPGVPINPMCAKVASDLGELLEQMAGKAFQADFKYDGVRAQVHLSSDNKVYIFSRHLENVSSRYPDVQEAVLAAKNDQVKSFIADAEIVAYDFEKKEILPFQTLQSRPRQTVSIPLIKVHVQLLLFDLMELNGVSLLKNSFAHRHDLMKDSFKLLDNKRVSFVEHRVFKPDRDDQIHDVEALRQYLHQAFGSRCEGLVVKEMGFEMIPTQNVKQTIPDSSTYEPSLRCKNWLKVKRDYLAASVEDSIDVVPIGAWYGNGRKAGWYSPFLVAVWDAETDTFQALCKIMSGFTDEFYKEQLEYYSTRILPQKSASVLVGDNTRPSVWFAPSQVWEMKCAELTVSPTHKAGVGLVPGKPGQGLSCRFPRFVRVRPDKSIESATSSLQIVEMYESQQIRSNSRDLASEAIESDEGA